MTKKRDLEILQLVDKHKITKQTPLLKEPVIKELIGNVGSADLYLFDLINKLVDELNREIINANERMDNINRSFKSVVDKVTSLHLVPGDKGERGPVGPQGPKPVAGKDYKIPKDGERGEDGKDADENKIVKKVLKEIPIPEDGKDGVDGSADTPEMIRDKLEFLKGQARLDFSAIKGLRNKIGKIDKSLGRRVGGGFSKMHMEAKMIDDETPTGTVNGVNKAFTLANTPNPTGSLKVYRGGARQRITEDYTLSGRTITFTIAPVSGEIILVDYRV